LGQRRAAAVQAYLTSYGVQPARLRLLSFGEEKPARPGHQEQDWALNRRDEFQVTF
jgi:peptidoglycan-associated lipoprotein